MRDSINSNLDPQPVADDLSDGYIADRLHWDSMDADPACPCSPTVLDSEPRQQDFGETPEPDPTRDQSPDAMVLEPADTISIVAERQQPGDAKGNTQDGDTGPCIPLENTDVETTGFAFPPSPPQLPVKSDDIRPEDALDCSVSSLDDLREGKLDTMEDRSETLVFFLEIRILSQCIYLPMIQYQQHCLSHRLRTYSMVRDDTGWVLRMYVHARRAYIKHYIHTYPYVILCIKFEWQEYVFHIHHHPSTTKV